MNIPELFVNRTLNSIPDTCRETVQKVVYQPCEQNWDKASRLELNDSGITLWQAVCHVDPRFPRRGLVLKGASIIRHWEKVPDKETIIDAIIYANRQKPVRL